MSALCEPCVSGGGRTAAAPPGTLGLRSTQALAVDHGHVWGSVDEWTRFRRAPAKGAGGTRACPRPLSGTPRMGDDQGGNCDGAIGGACLESSAKHGADAGPGTLTGDYW